MGGSRRKLKQSRSKVRVGLPRKNPHLFKPGFCLPPKLRQLIDPLGIKWDDKGSVISNYKSFGVVSNPNLLSVRSRTPHMVQAESLQVPPAQPEPSAEEEFDEIDVDAELEELDSGSDLEEDDLKAALGKQRRDGKSAPLQPLTAIQRVHIGRLLNKYGDDYEKMFMDTKLNSMQHSVATLEKLCKRYQLYGNKNPLLVAS